MIYPTKEKINPPIGKYSENSFTFGRVDLSRISDLRAYLDELEKEGHDSIYYQLTEGKNYRSPEITICGVKPEDSLTAKYTQDGECAICHGKTVSVHGNPIMWPIWLQYYGGNGDRKVYHQGCIIQLIQRHT